MKVLLVDPPRSFLVAGAPATAQVPLGLAQLAAVLRQSGHEVRVLVPDHRPGAERDPWGLIRRAIQDEDPGLVGITGMSPQEEAMVRLVAETRAALGPDPPLIVGGQHATCWPERVAAWEGVTAVVDGEGELALPAIVEAVERGADLLAIPGVVSRRGSALSRGPPRQLVPDLDALPFPWREGFVWARAPGPGGAGFPGPGVLPPAVFGGIIGMRGCPYGCAYCALTLANAWRARFRSPRSVVAEIEEIVGRHGATNLIFHDPILTVPRRRVLALMALMAERGIVLPFTAQTRADRVDTEVIAALARQGCRRLFLGIESGDEATLARLDKRMSLDRIRLAVRTITEAGIDAAGFFIIGFPWEDEALMTRTVDFALDLGLAYVSLHSAVPVPRSKLWELTPPHLRVVARDFVSPALNLTALDDAAYRDLFYRLKARTEAYNRSFGGRPRAGSQA